MSERRIPKRGEVIEVCHGKWLDVRWLKRTVAKVSEQFIDVHAGLTGFTSLSITGDRWRWPE